MQGEIFLAQKSEKPTLVVGEWGTAKYLHDHGFLEVKPKQKNNIRKGRRGETNALKKGTEKTLSPGQKDSQAPKGGTAESTTSFPQKEKNRKERKICTYVQATSRNPWITMY